MSQDKRRIGDNQNPIEDAAIKLIRNRPLTFYIHPRDVDLDHPTVNMPLKRKFKSLINIKKTPKHSKNPFFFVHIIAYMTTYQAS